MSADDKGFSEETCVRCGWRMGSSPLNCNNDNTPHRFPSQDDEVERLRSAVRTLTDRWMDAGHIVVMPPRSSAIRFEEDDPRTDAVRRALGDET